MYTVIHYNSNLITEILSHHVNSFLRVNLFDIAFKIEYIFFKVKGRDKSAYSFILLMICVENNNTSVKKMFA